MPKCHRIYRRQAGTAAHLGQSLRSQEAANAWFALDSFMEAYKCLTCRGQGFWQWTSLGACLKECAGINRFQFRPMQNLAAGVHRIMLFLSLDTPQQVMQFSKSPSAWLALDDLVTIQGRRCMCACDPIFDGQSVVLVAWQSASRPFRWLQNLAFGSIECQFVNKTCEVCRLSGEASKCHA